MMIAEYVAWCCFFIACLIGSIAYAIYKKKVKKGEIIPEQKDDFPEFQDEEIELKDNIIEFDDEEVGN